MINGRELEKRRTEIWRNKVDFCAAKMMEHGESTDQVKGCWSGGGSHGKDKDYKRGPRSVKYK